MLLPGILERTVIPLLSNALGAGRVSSARRVMHTSIAINAAALAAVGAVVGGASPWIMEQYGPGFGAGWPVLLLCVAAGFLLGIQTPLGNAIAASGRMWVSLGLNSTWALTLLAGAAVLRERGALGLALAYAVAYAAHAVWSYVLVYRVVLARD
jgi:O-antigen/teichoic acid export membrane protein